MLALCLVAIWPFLSRPALPRDSDAELHVFRVAELVHLVKGGEWYPRWATDFYYGYGYPLFNFYGPLTYYIAAAFAVLPGLDVVAGTKAVFVLGMLLAAMGAYAFARDRWGASGGILAAAAYVYAPYLLLFDPYLRGNLAETFALGVGPWALWGLGRLAAGGGRRYLVVTALSWAALLITHNVMALLFSGLLLIVAVFEWLARRSRRALVEGVAALGLGLGLAAFYWLPVLAERRYIQNENIIQGYFDFHGHFVSLGELLGPANVPDLGATFPDFHFNAGLGQVILVALVVILFLYNFIPNAANQSGQPEESQESVISLNARTPLAIFWFVVALGLTFLILPVSEPLWEAIPPLAYVQFPWKLLGPLAFPAAVLVGAVPRLADQLLGERAALGAAAGGLLLIWLTALPNTFPPAWNPDFGGATVADHFRFERQGRAVGTTSAAEYLPIWVKRQPGPSMWLAEAYEAGRAPNKLDPAGLPEGARVLEFTHTPTTDRFVVDSPQPFTARVLTFYFPGWRAWVDGAEVKIAPHDTDGFITLPVPAGQHTVKLRFGDTPPRTAGALVSLASLAALGLVLAVGSPSKERWVPSLKRWMPLLALALLFFGFKAAVIDRQPDWFRVTSTGLEAEPAQHALQVNFSDQVALLGYDLPRQEVPSGGEVPLTLYWKALQPVPVNYSVFVHLVRPPEHLWGQDDRLNPADFPMTRWPLDKYVRDAHRLPVLPGTPPGEYEIEVGFYRLDTGERLLVISPDGVSGGARLPTKVEVLPPASPPPVESLDVQQGLDAQVAGDLRLLGWSLNAGAFSVPDFAHLTLFWRAERDLTDSFTFEVSLVDGEGSAVATKRGPVDGLYSTSAWQAGEIVRDQYAFWLAEGTPPGWYRLQLAINGQTIPLAEIEVRGGGQ